MQTKKLMVCPKKTGNTYKVCSYAAEQLGANMQIAEQSAAADLSQYDTVILASGVYGGQAHKNILSWIRDGQMDAIKPDAKIYVLLTWIGRGKSDRDAFECIRGVLAEKGRKPEADYMTCFGRGMGFIKASHPDKEDLENVLGWAQNLG